jgi:hypothetical protein
MTNISIIDYAFSPPAVTLNVDDQVVWTWAGAANHSSTSDTALWNSGILGPGSSFTNAFLAAGDYPYHCTAHPFMTASITVVSPINTNGPPVILTQPHSQTVAQSQAVVFSVTAGGLVPLYYQWQFQATNLPGATGSALTLTNVQPLDAGPYAVVVSNLAGTVTSSNAILTVAQTALLTVQINGQGRVNPDYAGQMLVLGATYSMTAIPAAGYSFSGWSGTLTTNSPTIRFVMETNLMLQANFVPGAFVAAKGSYNGLFYDTNGVALVSAGGFRLVTTAKGSYSGSLQTASRRYPFSGSFDMRGTSTVSLAPRQANPLTLTLQLDLTPGSDAINGTLSDGTFFAQLSGVRSVFDVRTNRLTQAGKYTLVIPGLTPDAGDGFGVVSIDPSGRIKLSGSLADGMKISQSATLSGEGQWPMFIPLRGSGLVLSWITLAPTATNDLSGALSWIPAAAPVRPVNGYAAAEVVETEVEGSAYQPPARGTPVLNLSAADLVFNGGGLSAPITNAVTLAANNRITSASVRMAINPSSGTLNGMAAISAAARPTRFSGVVEQKRNLARGYFLGATQNGSIRLEAP